MVSMENHLRWFLSWQSLAVVVSDNSHAKSGSLAIAALEVTTLYWRMPEVDHRRGIAKSLIRDAIAMLTAAASKELEASDKRTVQVSLNKLTAVARSLSSTAPLGDDDAAARLSAVATSLENCSLPELKRGAHSLLAKAAKIFDELSQGS
jgi:hypothetical protein